MTLTSTATSNPAGRSRSWTIYSVIVALFIAACVLVPALPAFAALKQTPDPTAGTDGTVKAILRSGDTIYVGGEFQRFGTTTRYNLAAIDANTGRLKPWNPRVNCCVKTLAVSPDGGTIYAGGSFTTVGGESHNRIAAIDAATGEASDTWSPNVGPASGSAVNSIAVKGEQVYFGGSFFTVDGQARRGLAMVSGPAANLNTTFRPAVNGTVFKLQASANRLYIGGAFKAAGGAGRRNLAALSLGAGKAFKWRPNPGRPILDFAVVGKQIYTAEGGRRGGAAASYRIASGRQNWSIYAAGDVQTVAYMNRRLIVAGHFTRLNGSRKFKLAAVLPGKGRIDRAWRARPNASVWDVEADAAHGRLYLGGSFSGVLGRAQSGFAQFSRV